MDYPINLGQEVFSTPVSDLTLSLQASASVLLPPGSPVLRDSEHLKQLLCCGEIWVSQAPELKFNIRIAFLADLHPSFSHFVSQLGDSTCRAKIWTDLELVVLYKSCIFEPGQGRSTYVLSFGIQKRLGPAETTKALKLPKILRDHSDAIPPTNIPTVRLTSIDVLLEYTHIYKQCLKGFQQFKPHGKSDDIIQSAEFGDWDWDGAQYAQENILIFTDTHGPILEHDFGRSNAGSEQFNHSTSVSSNSLEFSALFQEALMVLVLGSVVRRRNNSETKLDGFQSLSKVAPGVFKPGYSEAMSQRSRLLPSIAKSLTSMLNLSDNQALKEKLASVTAVRQPDLRLSSPIKGGNDTKAILKMRLWSIAQKGLYHAPTPKGLRASSSLPMASQDEQTQDETLLSEAILGETEYFNDNCNTTEPELEFYPESNQSEPELDLGFNFDESEHSSSMIIFNDNETGHPTKTLEEHRFTHSPHIARMEADCQATLPYIRTLSLPNSEDTQTDHEGMLDFDTNLVEVIPALSSQTSFSYSPHSYARPLVDLCDDYDDEMLCDDLSA